MSWSLTHLRLPGCLSVLFLSRPSWVERQLNAPVSVAQGQSIVSVVGSTFGVENVGMRRSLEGREAVWTRIVFPTIRAPSPTTTWCPRRATIDYLGRLRRLTKSLLAMGGALSRST